MRKDQGGQGGMVINTASIVGKLHVDRTTMTTTFLTTFMFFRSNLQTRPLWWDRTKKLRNVSRHQRGDPKL